MRKSRAATIRVKFTNWERPMLFGTSYRTWWDQLDEFCRRSASCGEGPAIIERCEISKEPWIGFGGLKWCGEEQFQTELDLEGQGRKIEQFEFKPLNRIEQNCLKTVWQPATVKA